MPARAVPVLERLPAPRRHDDPIAASNARSPASTRTRSSASIAATSASSGAELPSCPSATSDRKALGPSARLRQIAAECVEHGLDRRAHAQTAVAADMHADAAFCSSSTSAPESPAVAKLEMPIWSLNQTLRTVPQAWGRAGRPPSARLGRCPWSARWHSRPCAPSANRSGWPDAARRHVEQRQRVIERRRIVGPHACGVDVARGGLVRETDGGRLPPATRTTPSQPAVGLRLPSDGTVRVLRPRHARSARSRARTTARGVPRSRVSERRRSASRAAAAIADVEARMHGPVRADQDRQLSLADLAHVGPELSALGSDEGWDSAVARDSSARLLPDDVHLQRDPLDAPAPHFGREHKPATLRWFHQLAWDA